MVWDISLQMQTPFEKLESLIVILNHFLPSNQLLNSENLNSEKQDLSKIQGIKM